MNLLKTVDRWRKAIMHRMTKNIGASSLDLNIDPSVKIEIKRVLVCRPNHRLGNQLLLTPMIQEVAATFPDCKIDLFVKGGLGPIIFANYKNINNIIQLPKKPQREFIQYIKGWLALRKNRYDLVINTVKGSSSGRLSAYWARATYKFFGDEVEDIKLKYQDHEHVAKYPIYNLRDYLTRLGFPKREQPIPSLDLKLSASEIAEGKKILDDLVDNEKKTICLFTYATGAKCYSEVWWTKFYGQLKEAYNNYNFIEVLPVENISKIAFKAPAFYSKDIREIGSVIAHTEVFIGADSGIMHLSSAVHTPTVGLFSVTNPHIFQPYNNNSVGINTNNGTAEDWIKIIDAILLQRAQAVKPVDL